MEYMSALQSELDEGKPSLFELISEQQLAALLPPTLRYLLVLATQRHPRYLLRILNSFDEVYALLDLIVQRHFLKTYGGSFTEHFYSLKRERVLRIKDGEAPRTQAAAPSLMRDTLKLTERDVWKNLAVMVGIPYVKCKLDEAFEMHAPQAQLLGAQYNRDGPPPGDATLRQRVQHYFRWFLRNIYPSLNAAYYFAMLSFNLAYLFSNTAYSSPFLWLVQTRIRRLGAADFHAIEALNAPKPTTNKAGGAKPGSSNSIFSPRNFTASILPRMLSSLRILLPTSIFALKFLEWWHASDFGRQLSRKASEGLELPPPIVAGVSEPPGKASTSKPSNNNNGSSPDAPPSPRRSALKQTSSVALANRPSTPPEGQDQPPSPSSPKSPPLPRNSSSSSSSNTNNNNKKSFSAPIAASSGLPILTVPRPTAATSSLCPICVKPVVTPTAAQTGFVYCYTCIFRWVNGQHERQEAWMRGEGGEEGWGEDDNDELERAAREAAGLATPADPEEGSGDALGKERSLRSRVGRWESGEGRCAVTGRRVLGGTECLRRIMV